MNKHTVFVAGKRFILLSDDKEAYVKRLAEDVSNSIARISADNPTLDRRSAALLCALDYADDMEKEKLRNKSLSDKAKPFINQADKQAKQIRELMTALENKDAEIKKLSEEVEQLQAELKNQSMITDGEGMVKEEPSNETAEGITEEEKTEENIPEPKPEKPMGRKKKKKNKGYKPMRQFSLFEDEKN